MVIPQNSWVNKGSENEFHAIKEEKPKEEKASQQDQFSSQLVLDFAKAGSQ